MIKFFRKIRQTMIEENKVTKYLLYAVGEVALVVIGILIALSIDNWSQQRKENDLEQKLLIQLKSEYQSNLAQLDRKIATRKLLIQSAKDLITYFDNPLTANEDSVLLKMSYLGLATTYDPIDNDLVRSGKISIVKNEKLKQLLTRWSSDVIQVKESENVYWKRYYDHIWHLLSKAGHVRSISSIYWKNIQDIDFLMSNDFVEPYEFGKSRHAISVTELLDNVELESLASNAIGSNIFTNLESITLRKKIQQILTILNQEIEKE